MARTIKIGDRMIGDGYPTYFAAEIGINHNGDLNIAKEVGLIPSAVAVALGACLVERHITLDRAMWGTDQAASVEPGGVEKLVKYLHVTEKSLGDGVKKVYESEKSSLKKLRRYQ
jgi:sialic acid synthase SpsE